jgi:hypothetical protein
MPLSSAESTLLKALHTYRSAVEAQKLPSPPDLIPHCLLLERLEAELAPQLNPRLHHFLESKSYRKAHDYLTSLSTSSLANSTKSAQSCAR